MTPTKKRVEVFDFAGVYDCTSATVAVHKDSKATTLADLNDKAVGTTFGACPKQDLTLDAAGAPAQIRLRAEAREVLQQVDDDLRA
ncbi:transporter substrate-binding domain-containing protein [Rhizobium leguminosarum]|uniref:transporter substrate-binding domain-containing protein n=1 Tax=Rhizobium leguminosarum TaxID=384 RepID=UPI001AE4222F|nr:transporter substrate-binding domain-containing protein [Rhizobium leguminosarum]MBP2444216.1 ABC-type amino acid transport substrate-binding protein [Rhizobium leguminosarum]